MAVRFPRRFAASLLAWLVAALLLAQGQGQLHGIVHGHATVDQHAGHEAHAGVEEEVDSAHRHADAQHHGQSDNWLLRLFAAHDGEAACRLFDQSSLGSCVPSFATPIPVLLLAGTFFDFFEAKPRLPVPTVARARGPPPVR